MTDPRSYLSPILAHQQFLKRRDECFYRLTGSCLSQLFSEYEDTGVRPGPEMVAKVVTDKHGQAVIQREPDPSNQGPRIVTYDALDVVDEAYPYLILDVRPVTDYSVNRIHRAKSFPAAQLHRDRLLPELYTYKNKDQTLIVVYDQQERLALQAAQSLAEKGYENLYVLSGGRCFF